MWLCKSKLVYRQLPYLFPSIKKLRRERWLQLSDKHNCHGQFLKTDLKQQMQSLCGLVRRMGFVSQSSLRTEIKDILANKICKDLGIKPIK